MRYRYRFWDLESDTGRTDQNSENSHRSLQAILLLRLAISGDNAIGAIGSAFVLKIPKDIVDKCSIRIYSSLNLRARGFEALGIASKELQIELRDRQ